jgi:D-alanyl-lipoteichoic acid acyltransferase DltB (MBOAT superfamily)
MVWGMFQKYVVADRLSDVVNALYADHSRLSGPNAAFAAVCFSFQIFCDFSGYSDIARGAAEVLGIHLSRNFNRPFHADSMAEYWKRWHMSLSSWMRDYVFFPLCGSRPRMPRICGSIIVVFLANALWHGARWNYMISGLLHGTYRVVELVAGRALSRAGWSVSPLWNRPVKVARTLLVFSLMTFAFLFFRGENLPETLGVVSRLFSGWSAIAHPSVLAGQWLRSGLGLAYLLKAMAVIVIIEAVQFLRAAGPLRPRIAALPRPFRWSLYYGVAASVALLAPSGSEQFIYFQF